MHPLRDKIVLAVCIVLLNLFVLESVSRLIVLHAKPTLGKTSTFDHKLQLFCLFAALCWLLTAKGGAPFIYLQFIS